MKILAVDDDAFVLEILRLLLTKVGYPDLTTTLSAGAALDCITTTRLPFQCILLDIRMPGMDGVEFCDLLRRLPAYRECPIIMITAMQDKKFVDQAYAAGASDYVTKPFDVDDLTSRLGLVARLLERRQTAVHVRDVARPISSVWMLQDRAAALVPKSAVRNSRLD